MLCTWNELPSTQPHGHASLEDSLAKEVIRYDLAVALALPVCPQWLRN
jgi:hypothetical protein